MLYTKKGDKGKTKLWGCCQSISKSGAVAEALGSLDEINSLLGVCKVKARDLRFKIKDLRGEDLLHEIQENLFIIQAELAGVPKTISEKKVKDLEKIIGEIEKELPPIKTFFISGGTELASLFDFARAVARRAERRVVAVSDEGSVKFGEFTLSYLNRLSSILYALARFANHVAGIKEKSPDYK